MRLRIPVDSSALVLALASIVPAAWAQDAVEAPRREVVSIVGASMSAGFATGARADGTPNKTVKLRRVATGFWDEEVAVVRDRSDVMTFIDPLRTQSRKIDAVLRDQPALVLALDFMFWFGYGRVKGGDEVRFGLQKRGFALLEKLDCPIVVGDYPDMHGADAKMLAPAQIPSVEVLTKLNEALREWAAGRENVRVFPLSEWVARVKKGGTVISVEGRELTVGTESLLQSDRLHPTRLAMALIGVRLAGAVDSLLPADSTLRIGEVGIEAIVDRAMARGDLTDLIESAKTRPAAEIKR